MDHESERNVMNVFGEGLVTMEPNMAEVTLGVVTQNQDLTVAQQENGELINQVIQAVMEEGVSREDIQTIEYSIQPLYDYVEGVQQFRGYEVTHLLQITIDEISKVGQIIDSAVSSGANRVLNISFSVSHPEVFYQQGLSLALEDAEAKAETLAEAMRVELDPVPLKVDELSESEPVLYRTFAQGEAAGGTPIEPGTLDMTVRIRVRYSYGT